MLNGRATAWKAHMNARHIPWFLFLLLPLYGSDCGEGDASAAGGNGGSGASPMGAGGGAAGGRGLSPFELLGALTSQPAFLIGAHATVEAGGRSYSFQLGWVTQGEPDPDGMPDEDDGFLLGGCNIFAGINEDLILDSFTVSVDLAKGWPRESNSRMSLWTPVGFPSDSLSGAQVQMGVFDAGSGEEWSVQPGGISFLECGESRVSPNVFVCEIVWMGEMTENCASPCSEVKESFGSAHVTCLFAAPDADITSCPKTGRCDDGNECTVDYCDPDTGLCAFDGENPLRQVTNRDTGEPALVVPSLRCRLGETEFGWCSGDTCVPIPCDGSCGRTVTRENACDCSFGVCAPELSECIPVARSCYAVGMFPCPQ